MAHSSTEPTLEVHSKLPFHGEYHKAQNKKFEPVIIIVPFYAANKTSLQRHVEFLNEVGFDVVTFHLMKESRTLSKSIVSSKELIGLKHIWADQIESILNAVPGKKIIFAFSNPSASAFEACVRRNSTDICGIICDSGPTGSILNSMMNYFTYEEPIKFLPFKILASVGISFIWTSDFLNSIKKDLEKIPKDLKILSIRGWKDKIISTSDIDKVFESQKDLNWQKLSLPKAGHLNGLRDFPNEYKPKVIEFLKSISK